MSDLDNIIFPPDDILNPKLGKAPNYEYIILWMLSNNDVCEWSDFIEIIRAYQNKRTKEDKNE